MTTQAELTTMRAKRKSGRAVEREAAELGDG